MTTAITESLTPVVKYNISDAAIKAPRQLSFANWRYRILHWAFGVTPESPAESPLPKFLYTHYCPLFHLTNLILLGLPLVIVAKVSWVVGRTVFRGLEWMKSKHDFRVAARKAANPQAEIAKTVAEMFKMMVKDTTFSFDFFWQDSGHKTGDSKESWKERWDRHRADLAAAKEVASKRAEKRRERIIFWSHVSGVVFRGAFYVGAAAAIVFTAYTMIFYAIPWSFSVACSGWDFLCGLATSNWLDGLLTALKCLCIGAVCVAGLAGGVWFVRRYGNADVGKPMMAAVTGAFSPVKQAGGGLLNWTKGAVDGGAEFASMFFAENCPPITIVDEIDEQLAGD